MLFMLLKAMEYWGYAAGWENDALEDTEGHKD
jgi:hypothetical protein